MSRTPQTSLFKKKDKLSRIPSDGNSPIPVTATSICASCKVMPNRNLFSIYTIFSKMRAKL